MTTYLSVCSGIEAATAAWHALGWEPVGFSEIEAFPSAVLAHHYPHVPNYGDMTALAARILSGEIEAPDILVGGTPCQAFSVAGLRAGLADPRGALTLAFQRLADAIDHVRRAAGKRPCVIVWENVPGVLSSKDNAFGCFLGAMVGEDDELKPAGNRWTDAGAVYGPARTVSWRILDAQYFGLAQRRRRVFVVASAGTIDPCEVLFERDRVRRDFAPRREAGEGPSGTLAGGARQRGGYSADDIPLTQALGDGPVSTLDASFGRLQGCSGQDANHGHSHLVAYGGNNTAGPIDVATARNASASASGRLDFESETFLVESVTHTLRGEGFDASEDGTGRGTPLVPVSVALRGREGGAAAEMGDDCAFTLRASEGGGDKPHVMVPISFHWNAQPDQQTFLHDHVGTLTRSQEAAVLAFAENSRAEVRLEGGDGGIAGALSTGGGKAGQGIPAVAFQTRGQDRVDVQEEVAYALLASGGNGGRRHEMNISASMQVRRLTPRECERLQGFPDDYTLIPWRGKPADACPDGPRYKALGNSMAVPVMRWIGRRVAEVLP